MYQELKPKFIIEDGRIVIGKVLFHKDLSFNPESGNITGGGYFKIIDDGTTFLLYGSSDKYGNPDIEEIKLAIEKGHVDAMHFEGRYKDFRFKYAENCSSAELAQERCVLIK